MSTTYSKVRALAQQLLDDTAITRRREAGEKLQRMLSTPEVRRRLAAEAKPKSRGSAPLSPAATMAARQEALANMWRFIVQNTILAVQNISAKKTPKMKESDILIPYKIIQCCDLPDETRDYTSSSFLGSMRCSISSSSKLSKRETRLVADYCMEMLTLPNKNDAHIEAKRAAEGQMLEMMSYICSRREYVAHFRPHREIQTILEEVVIKRFHNDDADLGGEYNNEMKIRGAAKIFDSLLKTCIQLGIGMNVLVPRCAFFVAEWCARMNQDAVSVHRHCSELSYLIRGLTTLMRSCMEQSISPLKRYGRTILSFAKRRYAHADAVQQHVLNEFFLCYLIINQLSGKITGLMPGDLDDWGKASMNARQLSALLELLMRENLKMESNGADWPLQKQERTHLELTVRLLASAQRLYLVEGEWKELKDPTGVFISEVEDLTQAENHLRARPALAFQHQTQQPDKNSLKSLAESPFMLIILRRLCQAIVPSSSSESESPDVDISPASDDTNASSPLSMRETLSSSLSTLLDLVSESSGRSPSDPSKTLIPVLKVLSACAEVFPAGECWTSSAQKYWCREFGNYSQTNRYYMDDKDNDPPSEALDINSCSMDNLAIVIHVVALVLESYGGINSNPNVQKWTLLCLLRLTESTASLIFLLRNASVTASESVNLQSAWRRVWSSLVRPDLRYVAFTKSATPGSHGEYVLLLLSQIVRQSCTDCEMRLSPERTSKSSTFLYNHQADIWNLPVFGRAQSPRGSILFELISNLLFSVGLSDQGEDSIDHVVISDRRSEVESIVRDRGGRRFRLLGFCLLSLKFLDNRRTIEAVSSCISALVHGKALSITFGAKKAENMFSFTMIHELLSEDTQRHSKYCSTLFTCLWRDLFPDQLRYRPSVTSQVTTDLVGTTRLNLCRLLTSSEGSSGSADFVPSTESDDLFRFLRNRLGIIFDELFAENPYALRTVGTDESNNIDLVANKEATSPGIRLSKQTLALKATLGVCLSCRKALVASEFAQLSPCVSRLFHLTALRAESLLDDQSEFLAVVSDLEQIVRSLVYVASDAKLKWIDCVVESASAVFNAFEVLLDGYNVGDLLDVPTSSPTIQQINKNFMNDDDSLFDDDDDSNCMHIEPDFGPSSSRKRKQKQTPKKICRAKVSGPPKPHPNMACAVALASALVSLKPSYSVCEFVAKSLLGVDEVTDSNDDVAIDPMGGVYAVNMLCTEQVMLYKSAQATIVEIDGGLVRNNSVISLICRIVELIRVNSGPDSELHLFGFDICSKLVCLGESDLQESPMSETEVLDIIYLLKEERERRSLLLRPHFRTEQITAAVVAFRTGKSNFHSEIDTDFPRFFVSPALCDLNADIRREASKAVAAVMRVLPEDKVNASVRKRLPPVALFQTDNKVRKKEYQDWYSNSGVGQGSGIAWADVFRTVEWSVIDCWSSIAGAASDITLVQQVLFDLVQLSFFRRELEALCFQALDRIAVRLGYKKAEDLVESEKEKLIDMWLKMGNSLLDFPFILSAPSLIRRLLQSGVYETIVIEDETEHKSLDSTRIRDTAASEFINRYCGAILPRILVSSVSSLLESSVTKEGRRRLIEDQYMKELCSVFEDRYDDDVVKIVLRSYIPDIVAYCSALQCGTEKDQQVANEVEILMSGLLSEEMVQRHGSKSVQVAVRRFLEISGMKNHEGSSPKLMVRFKDALVGLVQRFGNCISAKDDLFASIGCSMTEYLLFTMLGLQQSLSASQIEQRWYPLHLLFVLVVEKMHDNAYGGLQLRFCIHVLSTIILDTKMTPIHDKAIAALEAILREAIIRSSSSTSLKADLTSSARELLGLLMHVHENAQKALLLNCSRMQRVRERTLKQSLGIFGQQECPNASCDAWGWNTVSNTFVGETALYKFQGTVSKHILASLTGTYDVLTLIIEHVSSIGLESEAFIGASPPYEISESERELLAKADPRFCAQKPIKEFLSQYVFDDDTHWEGSIVRVPAMLKRQCKAGRFKLNASIDNHQFRLGRSEAELFSMEQRLLRAELVELKQYLKRFRGEGGVESKSVPKPELVQDLIPKLFGFCSDQYSYQVRLASARCLGELDLNMIESLQTSDIEVPATGGRIDVAIKSGHLLQFLQCQSIEVLAACLKAPDVTIALVAMDTLKALLATSEGKECRKLLKDSDVTSLLDPFFSCVRIHSCSSLLLTDKEVDKIKERAGLQADDIGNKKEWCWEERLWQGCGISDEYGFEEWICCLVPALLVCCYGNTDEGMPKKRAANDFFSLCQRMSYFDPRFAVSLFPSIILDLLEKDGKSGNNAGPLVSSVLNDTWVGSADSVANQKISSCFTALLKGCDFRQNKRMQDAGSNYEKAVRLAVECLDCLRLLTQHQFQTSRSLKKNSVTLRAVHKEKSSPRNRASDKPNYNKKPEDSPPWSGVPFGVVLRLDGLLVAQACLKTKNIPCAIFYAEMYADARFGGSTSALDLFTSSLNKNGNLLSRVSTTDISGFGTCYGRKTRNSDPAFDDKAVLKDGLFFLSILQKCFAELGEEDARIAVARQISDSSLFLGIGSFGISSRQGEQLPSLDYLQHLDNFSSLERRPSSAGIAIAECLESLNLRNTLQAYVAGLTRVDVDTFGHYDREVLRDKWFECRLFDMPWDDSIFGENVSSPKTTGRLGNVSALDSAMKTEGLMSPETMVEQSDDRVGFHEWMTKSLSALMSSDADLCCHRLGFARRKLLNHITLNASNGANLRLVDRFQALNDLECLLRKQEPIQLILKRWGLGPFVSEGPQNESLTLLPCSAKEIESVPFQDFSTCMREIVLRGLYANALLDENEDALIYFNRITEQLWRVCSANCQLGRHAVAESALHRLYSLVDSKRKKQGILGDRLVLYQLRLQEASLLESKGDFAGAIRNLKQTTKRLKQEKNLEGAGGRRTEALLAEALVTCGHWMTKHKVEPANSILDNYLKPGSNLSSSIYGRDNSTENARRATKAYLALSQLLSTLFETVSTRVKSLEWQKSGRTLLDRESELKNCEPLIQEAKKKLEKARKRVKKDGKEAVAAAEDGFKELMLYRQNLVREVTNVKSEREKIQRSVEEYRNLALESIASALSIAEVSGADQLSRHVYRMVSLWFSCEKSWSKTLDEIIASTVERVPTFFLVPLSSQLFSRVELKKADKCSFQARLQCLILKMCLDHPYHCIIHLITLANGKKVGTGVCGKSASAFLENANDSKVDAAKDMLVSLKKEDPEFIAGLIESYEVLADAYISLAMASTTEFHRGDTKKIPLASIGIASANRLDSCLGVGHRKLPYPPCILTKPPPLRPGCDYGDGKEDPIGAERISNFEKYFSITDGGLHRPKIVVCGGSKGGQFRQLVKGEDEIRQDAVMEQVFRYVNELMARQGNEMKVDSSSTNKARTFSKGLLKVFTYEIIPLSPASGVLQWVENSVPFRDYIVDKGSRQSNTVVGAHSKYFPSEWSDQTCREYYKNAPKAGSRQAFDLICDHYSPVFRFFFLERFGHSTEAWHAAKMRYTRSVAVNSIVGHVLGIGDRHVSNILVHKVTGEVVHIDFGIVFEQGKLLNTPEKVPFRLTRNIVDGMGVNGTEGTFSVAAEATLTVLKQNANALLTILSAIVADPLYKWSVSPVKARERQRLTEKYESDKEVGRSGRDSTVTAGEDFDSDRNEFAAHTISKINEKLQGYEDGTSGEQQSVEGQVQLLINSARDRDNLCEMFVGWAPWM